jgi:uncharacterized protein (DUF2141 family)
MNKIIFSFIFFLISTNIFGQCKLTLKITNVQKDKGKVLMAIYNNKEDYMKKHFQVKAVESYDETVEVEISDLKDGFYAITLFQDENGDQKLNIGMFGPTEAYAFSNNARGTFGPPGFDKAKFYVDCNAKAIQIINLK